MNSAASDPSEPPRMASKVTERIELVKLCSSKEWSKAIRILDSLLAQTCVIQDICNRAFCYSQLELHKHVIKDCDKALQLDPKLLQAYILKGHALSALGKKEEALLIWEQGYEHAVHQSADLKQLLELEELLKIAKQNTAVSSDNHLVESSGPESNTGPLVSTKSVETCDLSKASDGKLKACSNGMLESSEKSDNSSGLQNSSSAKKHKNIEHEPNELLERQANGTNNNCKKLGYPSLVCSELSDISEDSRKSSAITSESSEQSEPNELQEILSQLNNKCDVHLELSDEGKRNKKFCVTRVNKTKSINVDFRLSRGIAQVNEGRYSNAVSIFDQILEQDPTYPEALIGRGTALAFQRELDAAISDFTKAIQSNPSAGEAWKRRGQARAALGESAEAITDLTKALEFEPDSSDILHERGIVNFKFKDFKGAVEDLSTCVKFDKDNKSAYTYLGLALSSLGEYRKAEAAHKKAIQIERNFVEAWAHLAQDLNGKQTFNCLTSDEERSSLLSVLCDSVHLLGCNALIFYQDLANSEKALECLHQLLQIDGRYAKAYHLRGLLLHGMGEHRNAIKDLSMGLAIDSANIECLYLRASCYHAIGLFKEAVKDYDAALDLELDSMEKFVLQCLAFYQKEIALYTASKINSEFSWFDIDGDIDPLFKEYWCKRLHPKNVCEKVYRQPPLKESLKKGKQRKQEFTFTKQKTALLQAADSIGRNIQYHCPGFLHNRRQAMSMIGSISSLGETLIRSSWASASNSHRMAGLAAIEIAQKVSKAWRALQAEWRNSTKGTTKSGKRLRRREKLNSISVNRGGAGCSTSSSSETSTSYSLIDDRSTGRSMMSWNHLYSLAVKWRQISEPCDPVVWINKLSEEFNTGFGSHTPLVIGQAKVVRYYPNFQRTLTVAKAVIKEKKSVCNKEDKIIDLSEQQKLQEIMAAESCSDLYRVVGQDFWLATWCNSTAFEGKRLEGTRITVLKMGEIGYDFAIRTPCTPARWDDFDVEMTSAWEAVCYAYCGENYGSTDIDVLENVRDAILRMTYYWYNFMPLSRGTAVVGFIVLLGLLLAANMEFTGSIPKGLQVDWEAILEFDSSSFVDSVKRWLYPSLKVSTSWKNYPDVTSTFETTGSVVAALSNYSD